MMPMYEMETLYPDIATYAPSAPEPLMKRFIIEAARIFCDRVHVWYDEDVISISESGDDAVCTIQDADIVEIQMAMFKKRKLTPKTLLWLDIQMPYWKKEKGTPQYITQLSANTVTVVPKCNGEIEARLVLKPSLDAETLPRVLVDTYRKVITNGATGRLLLSPQPDIADPERGNLLLQAFNNEVDVLEIDVLKTQLNAPLRTTPQYF